MSKVLLFSGFAVFSVVGGLGIYSLINREPAPITLDHADASSELSGYSGKIGGIEGNKKYLVSATLEKNRAWFEWVHKHRWEKEEKKHDDFKSVSKGWDASNSGSLNKACETAYKKATSSISGDSDSSTPSLKESIKKFCSYGLGKGDLATS